MRKEPLIFLDEDIVRLIGETKRSQKEYKKFIYGGIKKDLSELNQLFEKEEVILGTTRFSIIAQKKYLRRRFKKSAQFGLL